MDDHEYIIFFQCVMSSSKGNSVQLMFVQSERVRSRLADRETYVKSV